MGLPRSVGYWCGEEDGLGLDLELELELQLELRSESVESSVEEVNVSRVFNYGLGDTRVMMDVMENQGRSGKKKIIRILQLVPNNEDGCVAAGANTAESAMVRGESLDSGFAGTGRVCAHCA
jgi:hypothetical protein